jgi:hypothetical protein
MRVLDGDGMTVPDGAIIGVNFAETIATTVYPLLAIMDLAATTEMTEFHLHATIPTATIETEYHHPAINPTVIHAVLKSANPTYHDLQHLKWRTVRPPSPAHLVHPHPQMPAVVVTL